jgi:hypothetical protein
MAAWLFRAIDRPDSFVTEHKVIIQADSLSKLKITSQCPPDLSQSYNLPQLGRVPRWHKGYNRKYWEQVALSDTRALQKRRAGFWPALIDTGTTIHKNRYTYVIVSITSRSSHARVLRKKSLGFSKYNKNLP